MLELVEISKLEYSEILTDQKNSFLQSAEYSSTRRLYIPKYLIIKSDNVAIFKFIGYYRIIYKSISLFSIPRINYQLLLSHITEDQFKDILQERYGWDAFLIENDIEFDEITIRSNESKFAISPNILKNIVQPVSTNYIKLNLTFDEYLKNIDYEEKRRYKKVTKDNLAVFREGVLKDLSAFYQIMLEIKKQVGFYLPNYNYFYDLLLITYSKFTVIEDTNGKIIGGYLGLIYNENYIELYGGIDPKINQRSLYTSFLKISNIKFMCELKCKFYDQWGASDHVSKTFPHLYHLGIFKKKFGGNFVEYPKPILYINNKLSSKIKLFVFKIIKNLGL